MAKKKEWREGEMILTFHLTQIIGEDTPVMQEWLDVVEAKFNTKPIIYCNIEYYNKYMIGKFDAYPIWIAHYQAKDKPRISNAWAFWQHNEHGHVTGIREDVDFNVFSGNRWQFNSLLMD